MVIGDSSLFKKMQVDEYNINGTSNVGQCVCSTENYVHTSESLGNITIRDAQHTQI